MDLVPLKVLHTGKIWLIRILFVTPIRRKTILHTGIILLARRNVRA